MLHLTACLVQVNDLEDAALILDAMFDNDSRQIDLTISKNLLQALFALLDAVLIETDKIGSKKKGSSFVDHQKGVSIHDKASAMECLRENLPKVLKLLGVYLGHNIPLFRRVLKSTLDHLEPRVLQQLFSDYFLGAACLLPKDQTASAQLGRDLWDVAEKIDVTDRLTIYQSHLSRGYLVNLALLDKLVDLVPRAIKWSKHLSDESDQIESMRGETDALTSGGNMLILASQVMKLVSNYNNLIRPLMLALVRANLAPIAIDMTAYSIVRTLSDKQDNHKDVDCEGNPPQNYTHLVEFASRFHASFPQADLRPLFLYIVNRMKYGDHAYESLILSSLLQAMSGWRDLEISQLNDKQL